MNNSKIKKILSKIKEIHILIDKNNHKESEKFEKELLTRILRTLEKVLKFLRTK